VPDDGKQAVRVWYDPKTGQFGMEGAVTKPAAARGGITRDRSSNEPVTLRVFLDRSILEVYCGGAAMTGRTFPDPKALGADLFAEGGKAVLTSLEAWRMKSMWAPPRESP
jgi:sucrose-6-phosphate hydrolase SacC (GH32 family)